MIYSIQLSIIMIRKNSLSVDFNTDIKIDFCVQCGDVSLKQT